MLTLESFWRNIRKITKEKKLRKVYNTLIPDVSVEGYNFVLTQPAITCSKLTIKTQEQGVKYLQS